MIPILIAFDGAAAAGAFDDELLLVPPQAAIHSPHNPQIATAASVRGSRLLISLSNPRHLLSDVVDSIGVSVSILLSGLLHS
jgi:hypothetical protein